MQNILDRIYETVLHDMFVHEGEPEPTPGNILEFLVEYEESLRSDWTAEKIPLDVYKQLAVLNLEIARLISIGAQLN